MTSLPRRLLAVIAVVTLAACTTADDAAPQPDPPGMLAPPVQDGRTAPELEVDPSVLPHGYFDYPAVAPGWDSAPQETDGFFVGRGPLDESGMAPVIAVDSHGTVLWRAAVPDGTDIDLSRTGEESLVVLTVPTAARGWAASAFELRTGKPVWEEVALPGPPVDPGLLVEAPEGRAAIDAASGQLVPREDDEVVLAEDFSTVVSWSAGHLRAHHAGTAVWKATPQDLDLPAGSRLGVVAGSTTPAGTLAVGAEVDGAPEAGTLVDLADGRPLAHDVQDARHDTVLGTLITLGGGTLSALDEGAAVWTREVPTGARLVAVDSVLAYLRVGKEVLVINTATGADAFVYDEAGPAGLAVPAVVDQSGAVALNTGTWVLLPTHES